MTVTDLEGKRLRVGSTAIESKERRLLLQASLQQAIIGLQGRVIAGADPVLVLSDLLRTIVDLSGSAAGFIAERSSQNDWPGGQTTRSGGIWRSVVTVDIASFDLPDHRGLIDAALAATGSWVNSALQNNGDRTEDSLLTILEPIRPGLSSALMLKQPRQETILCLLDRPDGFDPEVVDLLRGTSDVVAQMLAASRRAFATDTTIAMPSQTKSMLHLPDAHLAAILGEIAGVVWSASLPDFTLRYISPSVEKLLGYPANAFVKGREFLDEITPPEDQVLRLAALNRSLDGEPFDFVHRVICADGSLRWMRCKANVITDHNGRAVRLDGIMSDVTADRLAVERGRQSDALYRAVVEDQQEAIVRFRPDHVITFANRQYADLYNMAPEDLLGIRLSDLLSPKELADIFDHLATLSIDRPSSVQEYEKPLPGGPSRWIRWVNRALYDSFGQIAEYQCVGHDIGDLKRLESELEDGRELLSLAVASSGDGIFEWRPDDNYVWLSPRWKEMFGYGGNELPNDLATWEKLISNDGDRRRIRREIEDYLKNPEGVMRSRVRCRHRNGSTMHIDTRIVSRQTGKDGKRRLVGAMSDVTARVVAEQQMSDAIESLSDGFALFDADDRMLMHNKRFLEFFPFLAQEGGLVGVPFIDMVRHPAGEIGKMQDRQAYMRDRMKQHREGGSFELPLYNGGWVRVSERRTKEGGIVSIWSDITELKRAEARLLNAVATMQEGFLLVGSDEKIILTNQRCREIYEIAGHLLQPGASYRDFLRYGAENGQFTEAKDCVEEYIKEAMKQLYSDSNVRIEHELANGRWVMISQHKMSDGSSVGIRTDLTAQKRREAELKAAGDQLEHQAVTLVELAEKLEEARLDAVEASRAKTRFLAHMSHELRTPLNAVLGFTRLMSDELFGPIGEPKYKEYINLIHESGAHLLSLINDVLDLSKIEAGRMELDRRVNSVAELAAGSTRLMEGLAKDRQIKLLVQIVPGCETIYGDERSLKQMVINLLSNALKFTEPGGCVTLSFEQHDGGGNVLKVSDTGIGMSADDIVKALDPFGQIDGEIARQHQGTGLGLPLVKAMAEAHGGSLKVDSEPGAGTTITIYLPGESGAPKPERIEEQSTGGRAGIASRENLSATAVATVRDKSSGDAGAARPRILLAEDNPVNRRLVLDILRELPVEVDCAVDGIEATELVAANSYFLVLMDIQMPRMGGIEATQRIRQNGLSNSDLPIIALTAHAAESDRQRFIAAGMDGCLAKPFDVLALMKLVQKYLGTIPTRDNDLVQVATG